jgi:hypothetical protein
VARRKWEYLRFREYDNPDDIGSAFVWSSLDRHLTGMVQNEPKYEYASIREAGLDGWGLISFDDSELEETVLIFKREVEETEVQQDKEVKLEVPKPIECDVPLEVLKLPTYQAHTLYRHGHGADTYDGGWGIKDHYDIKTVGDVLNLSGKDLKATRNFGKRGLELLRLRLKENGFDKLCPPSHWVNNKCTFGQLGGLSE